MTTCPDVDFILDRKWLQTVELRAVKLLVPFSDRNSTILITADAGGSKSYRSQARKQQLQRIADTLDLAIHVSHFTRGTSKWNRLSTGCSRSSRSTGVADRFAPTRQVFNLINNTTDRGGLVVRALLDRRSYPIGKKVSAKESCELNIERDEFHGDWNYVINPRKDAVTSSRGEATSTKRPCGGDGNRST